MILAAEYESDVLFDGLTISYAVSGLLLVLVAIIGGKNSNGKRVFFAILGLLLIVVAALLFTGTWNTFYIARAKLGLCELFGPWAVLIWGFVGIFRGGEVFTGDKRDVPVPPQQNLNAPQWGQQPPQQWGQQQPPQQWQQQAPAPGQQQWGQQPPQQQPYPPQGQPPQQPYPPQQPPQQYPPQA